MVDFGQEAHFGRGHGVVGREEEFELEDAPFVGRVGGAFDGDGEVAQIVCVGDGLDACYWFGYEALGFLSECDLLLCWLVRYLLGVTGQR